MTRFLTARLGSQPREGPLRGIPGRSLSRARVAAAGSISGSSMCGWPGLFNHLVGTGEKRLWHGQAERLDGLQIDHQLKLGRLLDWQIGRPLAVEDLSYVAAELVKRAAEARSIADQAAESGEVAKIIDRRNRMACRQRYQLVAPGGEVRVGVNDGGAGVQLDERSESGVELALTARLQNREVHTLCARRFFPLS